MMTYVVTWLALVVGLAVHWLFDAPVSDVAPALFFSAGALFMHWLVFGRKPRA
jgi:hypothetical protein